MVREDAVAPVEGGRLGHVAAGAIALVPCRGRALRGLVTCQTLLPEARGRLMRIVACTAPQLLGRELSALARRQRLGMPVHADTAGRIGADEYLHITGQFLARPVARRIGSRQRQPYL